MKFSALSISVVAGLIIGGTAFAAGFERLPDDEVATVNGVRFACTGVGDEAKTDPRWHDFSVRLEFAGGEQQYLADIDITLETASGREIAAVSCGGPWILADLEPGKYRIRAEFEHRLTKTATFMAPGGGQKRVVIAFPEVVGLQ